MDEKTKLQNSISYNRISKVFVKIFIMYKYYNINSINTRLKKALIFRKKNTEKAY